MFGKIFNHADLMQKGLNASWLRQEVISNNISNNDTPNFKSSSVNFENLLRKAMDGSAMTGKMTRERHMHIGDLSFDEVQPMVVQNHNTTMRMDGNNVDIEDEMTSLAKNTIYYNYLSSKLTKEFSRLKTVISETR